MMCFRQDKKMCLQFQFWRGTHGETTEGSCAEKSDDLLRLWTAVEVLFFTDLFIIEKVLMLKSWNCLHVEKQSAKDNEMKKDNCNGKRTEFIGWTFEVRTTKFRKCLIIEMVGQCRCECFNRQKVISEKWQNRHLIMQQFRRLMECKGK